MDMHAICGWLHYAKPRRSKKKRGDRVKRRRLDAVGLARDIAHHLCHLQSPVRRGDLARRWRSMDCSASCGEDVPMDVQNHGEQYRLSMRISSL
jgi:hypothetical protein